MKRLISLVAAVALVFSVGLVAFAAPKVTTVESGVFVKGISHNVGDTDYTVGATLSDISNDYSPGDVIEIYLSPAKFTGEELNFTPENGMSTRTLENAGIQLRTSGGKNSNLIQNVSFKQKQVNGKDVAYIEVKVVDTFAETSSKDFETNISLYANKKKQQTILVGGTLANNSEEVSKGDGFVYLGDGSVVKAADTVNGIQADTGNDVFIVGKMIKGKEYYAVSKMSPTDADAEVMNKYPEIDTVVTLSTKGFDTGSAKVKIDQGNTYYAYSESGKYLGKTTEELALVDKYYLAASQIDMELDTDSSEEPGSSDPPETDDEGTEPGSSTSTNTDEPPTTTVVGGDSDIPDTGIPMGVKIALGAGVLSVGIITIVGISSRKKKK